MFLNPALGEGYGQPDPQVTWKNPSGARDMGWEVAGWSGSVAEEKYWVSSQGSSVVRTSVADLLQMSLFIQLIERHFLQLTDTDWYCRPGHK